jgi:hypothetical protein
MDPQKNRKGLIIFLVGVFVVLSLLRVLSTESRYLFLGFDGNRSGAVELKYYRDMVLRRMKGDGETIVPVMTVESIILQRNIDRLSELDTSDLEEMARSHNASFAAYGTLNEDNREVSCTLIIYSRADNTMKSVTFQVEPADTPHRFSEKLSEATWQKLRKLTGRGSER